MSRHLSTSAPHAGQWSTRPLKQPGSLPTTGFVPRRIVREPKRPAAPPAEAPAPARGDTDGEMQFDMDIEDATPSVAQDSSAAAPDTEAQKPKALSGIRRNSFDGLERGAERAEKKPRRSCGSSTPMSVSPSTSLHSTSLPPAPVSRALVPVEPVVDLQPSTVLRSHEFQCGRRVFHVHFGHGYVASLEQQATGQSTSVVTERVLSSKTHNINVLFDNPKYKQLRLRAFYAVPKMVVIPSATALRKRKLLQAVEGMHASPHARIQHVREVLSSSGADNLRHACDLVHRWHLHETFEPSELLQRLVESKQYAPALRFAREFGLTKQYPIKVLLQRMLQEKRYEGALKYVGARSASVDGQMTPADVLQLMVRSGQHEVALKYVHKFGASARFPPAQLVSSCLQAKEELSVRASAMLLKYVSLFKLEAAFPLPQLLERVAASGIKVHEVDSGKFVLKGQRRNEAASSLGAPPPPAPPAVTKVGSAPL